MSARSIFSAIAGLCLYIGSMILTGDLLAPLNLVGGATLAYFGTSLCFALYALAVGQSPLKAKSIISRVPDWLVRTIYEALLFGFVLILAPNVYAFNLALLALIWIPGTDYLRTFLYGPKRVNK